MSAEAVVTTEQFEYLKQENALLREQVEFLMRRLYGTKRESLTDGQVDLFDQTKTFVAPTVPEPEEQDDKPAKRKKQKGRKAAQLAPFPEVAVHHELTGAERQCPHCAAEMREIGATATSREPVMPNILTGLFKSQFARTRRIALSIRSRREFVGLSIDVCRVR